MVIYNNYNLKHLNSFKLDSVARIIYFPTNILELKECFVNNPDAKIIAGGTNLILSPVIDKVICLINMPTYTISTPEFPQKTVIVFANHSTHNLIRHLNTISGGFETLWGIPGTIGGAIIMNAGSMGKDISEYLDSVSVLCKNGKTKNYTKKQLKFKRRYCILQDKKEILLYAKFKIPHTPLNEELLQTAKENRKKLPHKPSAGGFFVNWHELKPYQEQLIGLKIGDVEISKSVNIIINNDNGTYSDVLSLYLKICKIVPTNLQLEVKFL
jgi:UDP-N-acetylmuramate dehydrogenase